MYPPLRNTLLIMLMVILPIAILVPEYAGGPVTFVAQLAFGWIYYLARVLPQVDINWPAVATTLLAATAFLLLAHRFARRLHRELTLSPSPSSTLHPPSSPPSHSHPWPLRWTLTAAATLLLMFTAGLAATGITHHTARLATMEGPVFVSNGGHSRLDYAQRVRCMSNLRQIGQALIMHARDHGGHFPAHLEDVVDTEQVGGQVFVCPAADDEHFTYAAPAPDVAARLREGHATYVYLTPNLSYPSPTRIPIVTEPLTNHATTGLNILYSDGSVQWHTAEDAQKILNSPKEPTP